LILFLHFKIRNPNHQNVIWAKRHRTTKAKYNKLSEIRAPAVFLPVTEPGGLRTTGPTDLARRFIHKIAIVVVVVVLIIFLTFVWEIFFVSLCLWLVKVLFEWMGLLSGGADESAH
jgi:hypothetical protein